MTADHQRGDSRVAEIADLVRRYVAHWRSADLSAWADLFTADCDFVGWTGTWWRSRAENLAGHEEAREVIASQRSRYDLTIERLAFPSDGTALLHVRWTWAHFLSPDGTAAPHDRAGLISMLLVREPDAWRIRSSHNTRIA